MDKVVKHTSITKFTDLKGKSHSSGSYRQKQECLVGGSSWKRKEYSDYRSKQGLYGLCRWQRGYQQHPVTQGVLGPLVQSRVGQQCGQWVPAGVSNGLNWNASSSPRGGPRGFPSGAMCIHGFYIKEPGFH